MKQVLTKSGAEYHIYPNGYVYRIKGDPLLFTEHDADYRYGLLQIPYEDVKVGNPFTWQALVGHYTGEVIRTSIVTQITMEVANGDRTLYVECPANCGKLLPGRRMQRDFCPACDSLGVVEVTADE